MTTRLCHCPSYILPLVLAGTAFLASAAWGQTTAQRDIDNYRHPPGTETVPVGTLGHIEERGKGPIDLVLIPGASFDWTAWRTFMDDEVNIRRFRMFAITPAGYGGTAPPPMPERFDRFEQREWTEGLLDAIVQMIEQEKLDRPIVVGHHLMGTYYAMRMALDHPDLIGGAVTLSSVPVRNVRGGASQENEDPVAVRIRAVHESASMGPLYRPMPREQWLTGTYKANALCHDTERADELYQLEISNPIPTQLRYFLEYMTDDPTLRMDELTVPLLAIDQARTPPKMPDGEIDLEKYLKDNGMVMFDRDRKPLSFEQMRDNIMKNFGSVETFVETMSANARPWGALADGHELVSLAEVEDTRIFIMEDQPLRVSDLILGFASGLR